MRAAFQPLLRKLHSFITLTDDESEAIGRLPVELRHCVAQETLIAQGQMPEGVLLLMSGFAVRFKLLADGRRQIVGFCLPGDLCDIRVGLVRHMDHAIAPLTTLVAGVIPSEAIHALMERHPRVAKALWWSSFVEESIAREWIVNVGYRSALERLAHLFCELYHRLECVGQARDLSCELPIRQSEMADTLALSAVHVNRTLMELRRRSLLSLNNRRLVIHDLPALRAAAGFDPAYLHLGSIAGSAKAPPLP